MPVIEWDDRYSVEIQEIDEQHKHLIGLINELYEALAKREERERIGKVLDDLVEYTKIHFAIEEALMRIFDYGDYDTHKAIHNRIVTQVVEFQLRFHKGDKHVGLELLQFLKDWLLDHIMERDKAYSEHFMRNGMKSTWLGKLRRLAG